MLGGIHMKHLRCRIKVRFVKGTKFHYADSCCVAEAIEIPQRQCFNGRHQSLMGLNILWETEQGIVAVVEVSRTGITMKKFIPYGELEYPFLFL